MIGAEGGLEFRGHCRLAVIDGFHCFAGALQGGIGNIGAMGIGGGFAFYRAQAEALSGVAGGGLEAAIIEHIGLTGAVFQIKLTVIGGADGILQRAAGGGAVKRAGGKETVGFVLHPLNMVRHRASCKR